VAARHRGVGILYGAVVALMQQDIKRLIAYSSVSHMGFVVLGTFALNATATSASVVQMINHGLSTGALFLLIGFLYERRHTRRSPRSVASPGRSR
jgi:NADH-quinone oxidoreductase subunit M